jgi:hypothetical protein
MRSAAVPDLTPARARGQRGQQAARRTMRSALLTVEESESLLNEGGMVLEDAAVPGVRENAQLCFR